MKARYYAYRGQKRTLKDLAAELSLKTGTLQQRLYRLRAGRPVSSVMVPLISPEEAGRRGAAVSCWRKK